LNEDEFTKKFSAARVGKKFLRTFLAELLPRKIADWHLGLLRLSFEAIVNEVTREQEKKLRENLFYFRLAGMRKMDYASCWTTRGGVDLKSVNMATLESKIHSGLFFAGEILDISGLCGGFNISFAAVSAKIVAESILKKFC
jgi:hypothetical protein